jgi:PhnB protein
MPEETHVPEGHRSITPALTVRDAAAAIDFYKRAFGAVELPARLTDPAGKILHVALRIGDSLIVLTDEFPEYGNLSPESIGGSAVRIALYVEDVDTLADRAVGAGAEVLIPVADQFYGDRSGRLQDPYGHQWIVSTHKEDMSPEEMQKRADALFSGEGGGS